ncbi:alpha 1,2-mannosyltransferase [Enteropsectra breve]|nr:alpha 1,2-mannosyltransferase [Enteropsectra breve]
MYVFLLFIYVVYGVVYRVSHVECLKCFQYTSKMHVSARLFALLLRIAYCRQNAVIMVLCRNRELKEIESSIASFEQRFNKTHKYPYVFLNDKEFTDEFKRRITEKVETVEFGLVEKKDWDPPDNLDEVRMKAAWERMRQKGVPYAQMMSYHNMCRFFSRGFYKHPLMQQYEFYWRIEPGVRFRCDIESDPFDFLKKNNKKYGFVITIREYMDSIPTLMPTAVQYLKRVYNTLQIGKPMDFMYEDGRYNGCHFWSNFEIASFEFFRSEAYNGLVDTLERSNGFYYERWGDAPVHSIALSLLLDRSEIHFFENIGYTHEPFTHCPRQGKNCDCTAAESIDNNAFSCLSRYLKDHSL